MSLIKFKQNLREKIDQDGFTSASDVLLEIEHCAYDYAKGKLADLRTQATQEYTQRAPDNFLVGLKVFIDSIRESNQKTKPLNVDCQTCLCNRDKQYDTFQSHLNTSKKLHTFFIHGDEGHGHDSIFNRFYYEIIRDNIHSKGKLLEVSLHHVTCGSFKVELLTFRGFWY